MFELSFQQFMNIVKRIFLCLSHLLVIFSFVLKNFRHKSGMHDYINANYVDGFREEKKFILTQSPMENTVESFWAMIYQENVVEIVAVTSLYSSKTFLYVPLKQSTIATFGPYSVKFCGSQLIRDSYEASVLKVIYLSLPSVLRVRFCNNEKKDANIDGNTSHYIINDFEKANFSLLSIYRSKKCFILNLLGRF